MGQTQSLKNLDKRTARREYREDFSRAIHFFREQVQLNRHLSCFQSHEPPIEDDDEGDGVRHADQIVVNVRKRPLFVAESKNSEFDVVSCVTDQTVIVHDARLDSDMKTQQLRHNEFSFHRVFDDMATNDDVYNKTVEPIVRLVKQGHNGTVFMYGQSKLYIDLHCSS